MVAFRQALLICVLAVPPAGVTALLHPRSPWRTADVPLAPFEVTVAQASHWGANVLWVDARSTVDYGAGHIPGAVALSESDWEKQFAAFVDVWSPERKVVVYCSQLECSASRHVAERLREDLGSVEVYFLRGGYEAWKAAHP